MDESWPNASYGLYLLKLLNDTSMNKRLSILSVKEQFYKEGGSREDLLKNCELNTDKILSKIK